MDLSVAEAKKQFSACLNRAQAGETIIVRKHGKPIARIIGIQDYPENKIKLGCGRGFELKILSDLTEPAIPENYWESL